MGDKDTIEALSMDMTGTTTDFREAFQQWQLEREALVDFYETMHRQDELLKQLQKHWAVVRTTFQKHAFAHPEKVSESIRRLNEWQDSVGSVHEEAVRNKKNHAGQLDFLGMIDNKKP
jgi:hypothetical protein